MSSAVLTIPNLISFARLLLMPVCAWLLGSGRFAAGFVLTALVATTDWIDGWLARRTHTVSRLGQLLDLLADRLLIASVAVALVVQDVLPWPAALLLLARDLLLLAGFQVLAAKGVRPPDVLWLGKLATAVLLFALPALVLGATGIALNWFFRVGGLVGLWVGVALYWAVGIMYVRIGLAELRSLRGTTA